MRQAEPCLTLTDAPGEQAQTVIQDGLRSYNLEQAGYRDSRPLAVLVSDPETQQVIGGLVGRTTMGLLFIDRFFLPESLRKNASVPGSSEWPKTRRSDAAAAGRSCSR